MVRRFWRWLLARAVRFDRDFSNVACAHQAVRDLAGVEGEFKGGVRHITGWHSEHVNDPELIHLWDTSQVAEFMLGYRELLQRAVAGRTLLLSRLKIDVPAQERLSNWKETWGKDKKKYEPRGGAGSKIYDKLTADFVEPWGDGKPRNFSILLYGPPGTGKSSLAENVAKALGMRMITVTVSDFLGRGGANVEARAKAIFQTLEAQFDTVILFDEIDSFLLDRDSERYSKQDSLFQFLTPGMLTKINDLRKRERSIFIIATNYANRIDPAIKRKGRIDQQYLLSLPDAAKRLEIIADLGGTAVSAADPESIRKETLFFGYSDLRSLVKDAARGAGDDAALLDLLSKDEYKPSTDLRTYLKRYSEENYPFGELLELIYLHEEVDGELSWDCLCKLVPEALSATTEGARKDKSARETFIKQLEKHYETRRRPPELGEVTQQAEQQSGGEK